jgi:ferric-dicitrate binding protein FerR (iron transport regulator)
VVETPQAEVRVRGTRFKVEVSSARAGAGITRVGVTRGSVLVRTVRGEQLLSGGESWSSPLAAAEKIVGARRRGSGDQRPRARG